MLEYTPATSTTSPTRQTIEANRIRQAGTWRLFAISNEAGMTKMRKDEHTEETTPATVLIPTLVEATPTAEPTITAVIRTWNHMYGTKKGRRALITPRMTLKMMGRGEAKR